MLGISAATNALNVGLASEPVVGPARTAFADLVSVLLKNAPEPPTVMIEVARHCRHHLSRNTALDRHYFH